MQNSECLVLLRPIFAPKMKTAPPTGLGSRSCERLAVIWTRHVEFFVFWSSPKVGQENWLNFGENLSFFFFLEITKSRPEKPFQFWWRPFFFGDHLILTQKPPQSDSRLMKIWVKFVYCCFHLQKISPFAKSWLRTWAKQCKCCIQTRSFLASCDSSINQYLNCRGDAS